MVHQRNMPFISSQPCFRCLCREIYISEAYRYKTIIQTKKCKSINMKIFHLSLSNEWETDCFPERSQVKCFLRPTGSLEPSFIFYFSIMVIGIIAVYCYWIFYTSAFAKYYVANVLTSGVYVYAFMRLCVCIYVLLYVCRRFVFVQKEYICFKCALIYIYTEAVND